MPFSKPRLWSSSLTRIAKQHWWPRICWKAEWASSRRTIWVSLFLISSSTRTTTLTLLTDHLSWTSRSRNQFTKIRIKQDKKCSLISSSTALVRTEAAPPRTSINLKKCLLPTQTTHLNTKRTSSSRTTPTNSKISSLITFFYCIFEISYKIWTNLAL